MEMFKDFSAPCIFYSISNLFISCTMAKPDPCSFPKTNKLLITIFASISSALCIMYPVGSILDLQNWASIDSPCTGYFIRGYTAGIVAILVSSTVKFVMYGSFYGLD